MLQAPGTMVEAYYIAGKGIICEWMDFEEDTGKE